MLGADIRATLGVSRRGQVGDWALRLIQAASPNPPGDTREVAETAAAIIRAAVPGADVQVYAASAEVYNVVAKVCGNGAGGRIILNGHLDTYPIGDASAWTADPRGEIRGGLLYGRGAADMKGGIAASIAALASLAHTRLHWPGEAVMTLGGDEETMGPLGTKWLMDHVPDANGDWAIIGDAGSPRVLRFGEKGFLWVEIDAIGKAAHGAHVHLGDNAIERLMAALARLQTLRDLPVVAPEAVRQAIRDSKRISEPLAGAGESEVLDKVTVNIGRIAGGASPNLVPPEAAAGVDIRLPVGVPASVAEQALAKALDLPGIRYRVLRRFEPNYTPPDAAVVQSCAAAAEAALGEPVAVNMRVGGSDARWFRMAGVPTVVYGPTPHGMGGPDEWVELSELDHVARVHALTAFDLLTNHAPPTAIAALGVTA
jgi:acetylornithine deacetylase/succinyl-diaminopimelate desuccinylase-like protein